MNMLMTFSVFLNMSVFPVSSPSLSSIPSTRFNISKHTAVRFFFFFFLLKWSTYGVFPSDRGLLSPGFLTFETETVSGDEASSSRKVAPSTTCHVEGEDADKYQALKDTGDG